MKETASAFMRRYQKIIDMFHLPRDYGRKSFGLNAETATLGLKDTVSHTVRDRMENPFVILV
ncbi:hypothetical protein ACFQ3J_00250 [Paenibacillus provencensis]|uniref:Transposase n=1 Tax=Paenibacillus provencensis TaxID=441151 RepID=A0ABW3PH01_9BACL|nr:hypothetical protein [Paenibacillus sp. MER 78]MCM3130974.1 hypothetical protein [Paenibacillus sp. MER 78]